MEITEYERLAELVRTARERGDPEIAVAIVEEVLRHAPESARLHALLGIAMRERRSYIDSRNAFRRAIELEPDLAVAHHGLGSILLAMGDAGAAEEHLRKASELDPGDPEIQNEHGTALLSVGRRDDARAAFERAVALKPDWNVPLNNLAVIALRSGDRDRAQELAQRSEEIGESLPIVHNWRGMHLLEQGEFSEGWREYEWRWKNHGKPPERPDLVVPLWDGSPLGTRTLLLWTEQGHGDILQFIRFASLIPKENGRVIVHAPHRLASVLATCAGVDQVIVDGDTVDIDVQFPLLSLPALLDAGPESVAVPYLSAPAECPDADAAIERTPALKVGIVWASGKLYTAHAARDCPLELFARLADIPGVRLYSLQYGDATVELTRLSAPIVDLSPVLGDFHKTAAFVKRLDLIISVDTSLPHLAGAIGAPVWLLCPRSPDWRWMRDRADSPWYPTMKLYRQEVAGEWRAAMERIATDLRELARDRDVPPPGPSRPAVLKQPAGAPSFIKQYGERRTGTNYLRALLLANYADVQVLIHLLGDKHSSPSPLDELRREARASSEPAWTFAANATFGNPAMSTNLASGDQLQELARSAGTILEAFDRGELRYVISVKDPYAWAVSIARHDRWIAGEMRIPPAFLGPLEQGCRRFNRVYRDWLGLADARPEHVCIVRHEDLVREPEGTLTALETKFGLRRRAPELEIPARNVVPAQWDGWAVALSDNLFDRDAFLRRRYLGELPSEHRNVVTATIDWTLLARLGYAPLSD